MDNYIVGYRNTVSVQCNQDYTFYYTLRSPYIYTCIIKDIQNNTIYSSEIKKDMRSGIKHSDTIQFNTMNTIMIYIEFHIPNKFILSIQECCILPMATRHIAILYGKSISKKDRWEIWLSQKITEFINQEYKISLFHSESDDLSILETDLGDLHYITDHSIPEDYILDSIQSNDRRTPYDKIVCIGDKYFSKCISNNYILRYKTEVYLLSDIIETDINLSYSDQLMKIICYQKDTYNYINNCLAHNEHPSNIIKKTYIPPFLYEPVDKKKQNQFIYVGSFSQSKSSLEMLQTIVTYIEKTHKNVYFLIYYNDIIGDSEYIEKIDQFIERKSPSITFVKNASQHTIQKSISESKYAIYKNNIYSSHMSFVLMEYEYYELEIIYDLEGFNSYSK